MNKKLIYVAGPTASGKTDLSITWAKKLNTEIISYDSRQFFRELKTGAAPPTDVQLAEVKHHFIACRSITESYTAGQFAKDATKVLDQIFEKKEIAILVGGSGLYADALTRGFDDLPPENPQVRQQIENWQIEGGLIHLQEKLKALDPEYFHEIDAQNPHRLIRALEVILTTGKKMSEQRTRPQNPHFKTLVLVMDVPRVELYARINHRVDKMVEAGLETEARSLINHRHLQTLNTVGYKEWFDFFDGKTSREAAINLIKQNTRRYAKRQLTWFRRYDDAYWFSPENMQGITDCVDEFLNE